VISRLGARDPTAATGIKSMSDARITEVSHVRALDGIRAFAILGVLAVHAGVPGFDSGWLGVDLFFALSGFLITTLLLDEWSSTGKVMLKNFWVRRFLRLMPAYYLYVIGITIAMWCLPWSVLSTNGSWTPLRYTAALWSYLMNYPPAGGVWNGQIATVHLWSLAVEEQYYVFWPLFLLLLLKNPKLLGPVSWGLFAVVLASFTLFADDEQRVTLLYTRGISLFLASAVAISSHRSRATTKWHKFTGGRANVFLTASLLVSLPAFAVPSLHLATEQQVRSLLPVLIPVYVSAIARLWYGSVDGVWQFVLTNRALVYVGKVSYGIYLYHEVTRVFTWWLTESLLHGLPRFWAYGIRLMLYVALSVAIASASFRFYERRFLALKNRFRGDRSLAENAQRGPLLLPGQSANLDR
jgi:peptidoglycan/LPS O-acetylase OafA/YrhL